MLKKHSYRILFLLFFIVLCCHAFLYSDSISSDDDAFLDKIEKDTFNYFLYVMNPETRLVHDNSKLTSPCNIGGVGFFLTALCIGKERGWISPGEARKIARELLFFIKNKMKHKNGFLYHFVSTRNGERVWSSEISSIDTALFFAGALTAGEYFKGEIKEIVTELFDRVQWDWMMNETDFLSMGWTPERGFLHNYWDRYAEHMILYSLAIGSETYPISPKYWYRWTRNEKSYKDYSLVFCGTGSLFVYQYAHGWIDFREINDRETDWWENSRQATLANRQFCIDMSHEYKSFGENSWGITACLGPHGYKGYGGEPGYYPKYDGTISPSGVGGSIVFTPKESIQALKFMYETFGEKIYDENGFKDAYNLDLNWYADISITISQGIMLLMIENYRSGLVWELFMKNDFIQNWIDVCELRKASVETPEEHDVSLTH
ncbi:glucoamylase family protein [Chlamydiota bacterium]